MYDDYRALHDNDFPTINFSNFFVVFRERNFPLASISTLLSLESIIFFSVFYFQLPDFLNTIERRAIFEIEKSLLQFIFFN